MGTMRTRLMTKFVSLFSKSIAVDSLSERLFTSCFADSIMEFDYYGMLKRHIPNSDNSLIVSTYIDGKGLFFTREKDLFTWSQAKGVEKIMTAPEVVKQVVAMRDKLYVTFRNRGLVQLLDVKRGLLESSSFSENASDIGICVAPLH